MTAKKSPSKQVAVAVPAPRGRSLDDFRSAHDKNYIVPKKIKDALTKLGNSWEYEADFVKAAGISMTDLVIFREQFESYIVTVKASGGSHKKNVWAGTPAFAAKLRELAS